MAGILFEDIFDVKDIDPDGKKFDRGAWNGLRWKHQPIAKCLYVVIVSGLYYYSGHFCR